MKRQKDKFPWDLYWENKNIQAKEVYYKRSVYFGQYLL